MKITFIITTTLYFEIIVDNIVDVMMFCEFKNLKMT